MKSFLEENSIKILNSLPEGVYVIDKEFKIRFVNNAAAEITGIAEKEVINKVCRSFCKSERCEIGCPVTEVLRTGKSIVDLAATMQHKDSYLIPVILNASILKDEKNNPIGGIISFKKNKKVDLEEYMSQAGHFYGIVGKSKAMFNIFKEIKEISHSYASVLITGETGVGKELIANAIQKTSRRANAPYLKVNCAVLPNELLASELFGHVKGAFTDARNDRVGRFEFADGGTLFLDEIAELPIEVQAKLLRVLQDGSFERIGESKERKTDIRIIAATNKNIIDQIDNKKFREDLFYRLNVIPIHVPPLRERKEDIIHLTDFFIKKYCEKYEKKIESVDNDTMDIFFKYNWPGNVRELENAVEYAFIRSKREDYLCVCCLPKYLRENKNCSEVDTKKDKDLDEKTETILSLLRQNNWNKTKVAKILGVNRSTIHRQLKKNDDLNK